MAKAINTVNYKGKAFNCVSVPSCRVAFFFAVRTTYVRRHQSQQENLFVPFRLTNSKRRHQTRTIVPSYPFHCYEHYLLLFVVAMLSRPMSIALTALLSLSITGTTTTTLAFAPPTTPFPSARTRRCNTLIVVQGYLDDLSAELNAPDSSSTREDVDTQSMNLDKESVDRYGVGSWEGFVDFDEFDGGDGQMGVAGDGTCVKVFCIEYCEVLTRMMD